MQKTRIYLTGIGGQGTLTATNLLSQIGLDNGLDVTSGEIHGMAQRGGVVASTILFGGYQSPKISPGEADILLGFEPLETYRALCFLAPEAVVVSNSEPILPIGVAMGREEYPDLNIIRSATEKHASRAYFLPCISLAKKAGTPQAANIVLLGALCALEIIPIKLTELTTGIRAHLKPKIVDMNLRAVDLGAHAVTS
ncbi:MAG: indolepyruvate oxidoreductase subunit beta [Desulfoplanes sp.]|jgi:indolepyruvate ferredoxin oxidoreductase beta subunit